MAYTPTNWQTGDVVTAEKLNNIENGISNKQDILANGVNIKTINNRPILGEGDLAVHSSISSAWNGKKYLAIGDSITAGSGTTTGNRYWEILANRLGMTVNGQGVGGSCFSTASDYGTGNQPLINRWNRWSDEYDLITVFMGTNDYGHATPLGTIADTTDISFYGALNIIIPGMINRYTKARIIFFTPIHRYAITATHRTSPDKHDWILNDRQDTSEIADGWNLYQYAQAIKDVCERWGIPVVDMLSLCPLLTEKTYSRFSSDGLHPNATGHNYMANIMGRAIESLAVTDISYGIIDVTGLTISPTILEFVNTEVGATYTITPTVLPVNATNKEVTWTSSNDSVATVSSAGVVTKVSSTIGDICTITATTVDGGITATATVSIIEQRAPEDYHIITQYGNNLSKGTWMGVNTRLTGKSFFYVHAGDVISINNAGSYKYAYTTSTYSTNPSTDILNDGATYPCVSWTTNPYTVPNNTWIAIALNTQEGDLVMDNSTYLDEYITVTHAS